jgi:carboxymethylenebutenolidase
VIPISMKLLKLFRAIKNGCDSTDLNLCPIEASTTRPRNLAFRPHHLLPLILLLAPPLYAQDWAKEKLDQSPRHHEWVKVEQGGRQVHSFLVFPEVREKATAVIVIHENRGLTDWVRLVADQLAEAGYIAIAPDLLSGSGPDGGKTSDFPDGDAAREALYRLSPEQVTADLLAVARHASHLPAANSKVVVSGFCWGGSQAFQFAADYPELKAAFVFYGTGPDSEEVIRRIECPVYGFYGSNDARVNATIPQSAEAMKQSGKTFEPVIYEGAGHGFMRSGEDPQAQEANKRARQEAWQRWRDLLKQI